MSSHAFKEFFGGAPYMKAAMMVREHLSLNWFETSLNHARDVFQATARLPGLCLEVRAVLSVDHQIEWQGQGLTGGIVGHRRSMLWSEAAPMFALTMLETEAAAAEDAGRRWLHRLCARCGWAPTTPGAHHCAECATGLGRGPWKGQDFDRIVLATMKAAPNKQPVQLNLFESLSA